MSFTEIFLRILIVMWFPVWTTEPENYSQEDIPRVNATTTHISRWEWVGNVLINPLFLTEIRTCVSVFTENYLCFELECENRQRKCSPVLHIYREWMHFLVCFPKIKENKDGSDKRTVSSGSGNNVPWPLGNLALISGCLLPMYFQFWCRNRRKRTRCKNGLKRASAGNLDGSSEGSSPALEPQATWITELSPRMVHPSHPHC